jgi:hypothetical protein
MKDAKGHGSDPKGGGTPGEGSAKIVQRQTPTFPSRKASYFDFSPWGGGYMRAGGHGPGAIALPSGHLADIQTGRVYSPSGDTAKALAEQHGIGTSHLTPVQSENAPFKSRLGPAAGHSFLDPHDPRARK